VLRAISMSIPKAPSEVPESLRPSGNAIALHALPASLEQYDDAMLRCMAEMTVGDEVMVWNGYVST
jgi:hypothetical protein